MKDYKQTELEISNKQGEIIVPSLMLFILSLRRLGSLFFWSAKKFVCPQGSFNLSVSVFNLSVRFVIYIHCACNGRR